MKRWHWLVVVSLPMLLALQVALPGQSQAHEFALSGLKDRVEVLRDRWGVPHIYASNTSDLFFAQGYITAHDRLFQIDLWRRIGTGKLAEVLGPAFVRRDRIARLVRYRGDWDEEWKSYSPDAKQIATAFTEGINAYIRSLAGKRIAEFRVAGYDPGLWQPEDVTARIAGLLMTGNLTAEVNRTIDVSKLGLEADARLFPPEPEIPLLLPRGLEITEISPAVVKDYIAAIGEVHFPGEQGSNNWVVDGSMTKSGKPLLANDPHRGIELPSLRKTVHLVGPGWNVIGAGEPALPGIALGHNENIAWGFTIVGIDQQDLYVEKVKPDDASMYLDHGAWKKFTVEQQTIPVKGESPHESVLKYTKHGPVIYEDESKHRAYALKWVGTNAGGAGYLSALSLARAQNWNEFRRSAEHYKIPAENLVYADRDGNIGWIAAGQAPLRKAWHGLFPVPGDTGEYEWTGFLPISENPSEYNPGRHFIATANHDILPAHYSHELGYTWAPPTRYKRIVELLTSGQKFTPDDFARFEQDTVSLPARDFQNVLRRWKPEQGTREASVRTQLLDWDCNLALDSKPALVYEVWIEHIHRAILPHGIASIRLAPDVVLRELEARPDKDEVLKKTLEASFLEIRERLGPAEAAWTWGNLHKVHFRHLLRQAPLNLPDRSRPGDAYTVNATGGLAFAQTHGASYREIIDVSNWDRSIMTNVPGESGLPGDRHYGDLVDGWAEGHYHPMPYSRSAVEAVTEERLVLTPASSN